MVMRNSRGLPLVGIVEFILYGCAKYFRERYMAISADLNNPSVLFGKRIAKYMETKTNKAQIHDAKLMGTRENMHYYFKTKFEQGPLRAHARLRFKQRAPADDGSGAKEPCPRAPVNKDGRPETDPYAHLWPWGDYFPDDDELRREDFSTMQERFSRESTDAVAALKGLIAGVFRPLLENFHHLRSLKTVYDTEDYHIGMPFGALIAFVGCYQLWKMDPHMFLTTALGYAFYKLSVVSSQLRKQGFANDLITRLKFVIMVLIMVVTYKKGYDPLDAIKVPVCWLYALTFAYEVTGLKKQFKYAVPLLLFMIRHPEGRRELRAMLSEVEVELVSECGIAVI